MTLADDGGMTVTVRIELHLEVANDHFTWWAKSPDVRGLFVAADVLHEVVGMTESTIADLWAERNEPTPAIAWSIAGDRATDSGPAGVVGSAETAEVARGEASHVERVERVLQLA